MKKKRVFAALLAAALYLGSLIAPAAATEKQVPEIDITWLSMEGAPQFYIPELNWLAIRSSSGCVFDLTDGVETPYDNIGYSLSEGLVWAEERESGDYVYLDKNGEVVLSVGLEYNRVWNFSDGLVCVGKRVEVQIVPGEIDYASRYGFIDTAGQVAIPLEYCDAGSFSEGLAWVRNDDGKCGFIDKTGAVVIPFEYDAVSDFSGGMAWVMQEVWDYEEDDEIKYYGFIDKTGKLLTAIEYYSADMPSEGLVRVRTSEGYGFIDTSGQVLISPKYESAGNFSEDLACVRDKAGNYGYIDKTGNIVVPLAYSDAGDFSNGLARVQNSEGNWGYIDKAGEEVIPLVYGWAGHFRGGLAVVKERDGDCGVINQDGEIVLPLEYDNIGLVEFNDSSVYDAEMTQYNDIVGLVQKGSIYGVFKNPYWAKSSGALNSSASSGGTSGGFPVVPAVISGGATVSVLAVVAVFVKKKLHLP